jgi:transposase
MTMLAESVDLVVGVDTHKHTNTAAVVRAATGGVLDQITVPTTRKGHQALLELARSHGSSGPGQSKAHQVTALGSPGSCAHRVSASSSSSARHAATGGVGRSPTRSTPSARHSEALARPELGDPRSTGERTMLSVLLAARRSALAAATAQEHQIGAILVAAPEALREKFRPMTTTKVVVAAARMRVNPNCDAETRTTAAVLRTLARRVQQLRAEANTHERELTAIVRRWHPELLEETGVGPIVAATVLCAWSHSGRFRSEAAFASLAGVAPVPASSGLTVRHRLNRRGDRQLNRALHTVVLCRVRYDEQTRTYLERRRAEGKTDREIKRCLKRYVARRLFRQLEERKRPLDTP